jgi:hypothetical protein
VREYVLDLRTGKARAEQKAVRDIYVVKEGFSLDKKTGELIDESTGEAVDKEVAIEVKKGRSN